MTLNILLDMNLSPRWVERLQAHGWSAVHWSSVGQATARDTEIMAWARANQHIVFTHDLDFGTILALSHEAGPCVLQVRAENIMPERVEGLVIATLTQHEADLIAGALIVIDQSRSRVRLLPIGGERTGGGS